jgi:ABC-type oligopeptide transport system ATPase subunit
MNFEKNLQNVRDRILTDILVSTTQKKATKKRPQLTTDDPSSSKQYKPIGPFNGSDVKRNVATISPMMSQTVVQPQTTTADGGVYNPMPTVQVDTVVNTASTPIVNKKTKVDNYFKTKHIKKVKPQEEITEDYFRRQPFDFDRTLISLTPVVAEGYGEMLEDWKTSGCRGDVPLDESDTITERVIENREVNPSRLNKEQTAIFEYVKAARDDFGILTIQAGPGCGKSFTLKSMIHHLIPQAGVIIFKHDLLDQFRYAYYRSTCVSFFMRIFKMDYYSYRNFERQLSSKLSIYEFIVVIVECLRNGKLPPLRGLTIVLDEYTIIPKPLLTIMLILFEYHKINTILCGDKDQLQNIYNSPHTTISSYKIACSFSNKVMRLSTNERCRDRSFSEIIDYFAAFSSDIKVDLYTYAILAALFPYQLITEPNYLHLHMASTHTELTDLAHMLVCNNNIPVSFYFLEHTKNIIPKKGQGLDAVKKHEPMPEDTETLHRRLRYPKCVAEYSHNVAQNAHKGTIHPGKFLPYLPLVRNALYYLDIHSEKSLCRLVHHDQLTSLVTVELVLPVAPEFRRKITKKSMLLNMISQHRNQNAAQLAKIDNVEEFVDAAQRALNERNQASTSAAARAAAAVVPDEVAAEPAAEPANNDDDLIPRGVLEMRCRQRCDKCLFDAHFEYLISDCDTPFSVFNYPIYPANFMTIHKAQGCTIREPVDLIFKNISFQQLYVAISRVQTRDQIVRMSIPSQQNLLVSSIVNFPELINGNSMVMLDSIKKTMPNYRYYDVTNEHGLNNDHLVTDIQKTEFEQLRTDIMCDVMKFLTCSEALLRKDIRDAIIKRLELVSFCILIPSAKHSKINDNVITISKVIEHRDVITALASMIPVDSYVWLHEYIHLSKDMIEVCEATRYGRINVDTTLTMKDHVFPYINTLSQYTNLSKVYSQNIASYVYIKHASVVRIRITDEERDYDQKSIIEQLTPCVTLELTPFTARVYKRTFTEKTPITIEWLMEQLPLCLIEARDESVLVDSQTECINIRQTATNRAINIFTEDPNKETADWSRADRYYLSRNDIPIDSSYYKNEDLQFYNQSMVNNPYLADDVDDDDDEINFPINNGAVHPVPATLNCGVALFDPNTTTTANQIIKNTNYVRVAKLCKFTTNVKNYVAKQSQPNTTTESAAVLDNIAALTANGDSDEYCSNDEDVGSGEVLYDPIGIYDSD